MLKKIKISINLEIVVVVIIACCMLLLNFYTTSKLRDLEDSSNEAMFIRNDLPFITDDTFNEEILEYKPDACKMIEMYDDQYQLLLSIRFDSDHPMSTRAIREYPDIISTIESTEAGQVNLGRIAGDYEERVYFQWMNTADGKRRLMIVYSTRPAVDNLWVFSAGCYFVLLLVIFLLVRLQMKQCWSRVEQYQSISNHMRD